MNMNQAKIFLTVGNEKQKKLTEKLLSLIREKEEIDVVVIPDDKFGTRIGSGGAVLNVIQQYYNCNDKAIIINSGGMSKRSINYALRGKVFSSIKIDNEEAYLLNVILKNALKIIDKISTGILICCSDIVINSENIDISDNSENIGFCIKTDCKTGTRHGVMLPDEKNYMASYMHKCSEKELKSKGLDDVLIDTGITCFSNDFCLKLKELYESNDFESLFSSSKVEINLYSDIIALLANDVDKNSYLKETQSSTHYKIKNYLFEAVSQYRLKVYELSGQQFLHFGSLSEASANIFTLSNQKDKIIIMNSILDKKSQMGDYTIIDNSQLSGCKIGSGCIISDITLENVTVDDKKSLCGIRLIDGSFVSLICDIEENPKTIINGESLWDLPRFFKAESFTASLKKFYNQEKEQKVSLGYCLENADYDYYFNRQQYLRDMSDYTISPDYLEIRKSIISNYFSRRNFNNHFICQKDKVEVNLPLRINLSGTWTDAMPYCIDNGGQVINMAVKINGSLPVKVTIEKLTEKVIEFCSDSNSMFFDCESFANDDDMSDFNLHKAALKTIGFSNKSTIVDGFRLTTNVDSIDKGSGLGTSSILLGGCFMALDEMFGLNYDEGELLKMVFVAEQIMKTGGGWQDQVGGLTPGLKAGTTLPGIEQDLKIDYIEVSPFFKKLISERLLLLPTGQRHFGRFIVNDVVNRYLSETDESLSGHIKIRELNHQLIRSFENDDYQLFCNCVNTHRQLLKLISHKVTNSKIEKMVKTCFEKADAVSYLGAGGGGYLLIVLKEDICIDDFIEFAKVKFPYLTTEIKKIDICFEIS